MSGTMINNFLFFTRSLLTDISNFLLLEPICYFVGIFLVLAIAKLVVYICQLR